MGRRRVWLVLVAFGGCAALLLWWQATGVERPVHAPLSAPPALDDAATFTLLALGQSNAANHGRPRGRGGEGAYAFFEGAWFPADDPLPGATGRGGSVWTRLAPRLRSRPEVDTVVVASIAQTASYAAQWAPGGVHHPRIERAVASLRAAGLGIDAVVWHQGESEARTPGVDASAYGQALRRVFRSLRTLGVTAPIFVCQTSLSARAPVHPGIVAAQAATWNGPAGIYAGADTDSLGAQYRRDGVHFDAAGLEHFAQLLDEALRRRSTQAATIDSP